MTARVLIVDDHATMRMGFRTILEASGLTVVGEAATGAEAVDAAASLRPDVICMDVQMPDLDGIEATRRILAAAGDHPPRVVIVTTFDRDDYLFEALDAGASGFLLKNAGPEELVSAVRVVAAGDALLAPEVTRRVIERFARPTGPDVDPGLTEREREVLRLLAQALSNSEIATRLFIGEATVKTHVSNVLAKLGARDRVAAVVYAHRHGLA
ncbi:response regulator [Microbacterium marinilacus]|uniref:Response regulator transcription factor n=1 Tax=Microbacterium marinilacus TaxID=415209 RepID=A0ABP7BKA1_9MICO|nr:response regulator transcription factor [Microbacterium marinilacus]MBY0689677.1 response regulator transcription factor [Microbacterium marinilacus]